MTTQQDQEQGQAEKKKKEPRFLTNRVLIAIEVLAFLYMIFVLYMLWF